ncbi:MAG: DUF1302 family protein [Deltaproteobacteria bacterium]|nr:MAG: DUF1302 family protein [Deltaproteobacteria bacterium]
MFGATLLATALVAGVAFAGPDSTGDGDEDDRDGPSPEQRDDGGEEDAGDEDPAPGDDDEAGWGDDEDGWGEDDAGGFAEVDVDAPEPGRRPSPVRFGGSLATAEAFWLEPRADHSAFAKARQSADLWLEFRQDIVRARVSGHGEYDIAMAVNHDEWDPATLDEYRQQLALRDAWVSISTGALDTTLGRQVVGWGEGRMVSVVDLVNPRDLREPGMVDLEDLRLPVTMARLSLSLHSDRFWTGSHRFEAMVVPEADFGYRSPPNGPFGNLPGVIESASLDYDINGIDDWAALLSGADISWNHVQKRWDLDQLQAFGRWSWRGRGVDLALMAATLLDQQGVFLLPELTDLVTAANTGEPIAIDLDHRRFTMFGTSGAGQLPWLLLRWELACKLGVPVNAGEILDTSGFVPTFAIRTDEVDLVQGLLGLSWSGWKGTTLDVDLVEGIKVDGPDDYLFPVDASSWSARFAKPLLRQRMEVEAMVLGWGWTAEYGWAARGGVSYEITDGLAASVAAITYHPGIERGPLLGFDAHDRAQVGLRWDF